MRKLLTTLLLLMGVAVFGAEPKTLKGTVLAVVDGDGYTYLQVDVGGETIWGFGPKAGVRQYQAIAIPTDKRKDVHTSKDLDRVFQGIYYVEDIGKALVDNVAPGPESPEANAHAGIERVGPVQGTPVGHPPVAARMAPGVQLPAGHPKVAAGTAMPGMETPVKMPAGHPKVGGMKTGSGMPAGHPTIGGMGGKGMATSMPPGAPPAAAIPAEAIEVEKAEGGKTIAEVFAGKGELAGQEVLVRAQVVRVNRHIMGRNWLHIQDGTGAKGTNEITVTTDQDVPDVGTVVLIRGKLALDRDFGYGYTYGAILEEAELKAAE